jgi:hypothetical protein
MAKYIKPKFSFTSNNDGAANNPGPMSFGLSLATVPTGDLVSGVVQGRLAVDTVDQRLFTTSTTLTQLLDGFDVGGATKTVGSVGCYIYLKNHSVTANEHIMVAIVTGSIQSHTNLDGSGTPSAVSGTNSPVQPAAALTSALDATDNKTLRTFTLRAGEFAFFPFDYTGDIYYESATGNPKLEYWRFDKA